MSFICIPRIAAGTQKVTRKQLILLISNFPSCTIVMVACAGSHCPARVQALGHYAKLIAPQFVKGNKNDFVDAEAICEAAACPAMRFVAPKTETRQTLNLKKMRMPNTCCRFLASAPSQPAYWKPT